MQSSCVFHDSDELVICNQYAVLDWDDSAAQAHCTESADHFASTSETTFLPQQHCEDVDATGNLIGTCLIGDCWMGLLQFYYSDELSDCEQAMAYCEQSEGLFIPSEECAAAFDELD